MSGYGFRHAARMERIKLRSVRSTWWLAIAAVFSMAAAGAGVGLGYRSHTPVATAAIETTAAIASHHVDRTLRSLIRSIRAACRNPYPFMRSPLRDSRWSAR